MKKYEDSPSNQMQSPLLRRLRTGSCLMLNSQISGTPYFTLDGQKISAKGPMALIRENILIEMNSIWVLLKIDNTNTSSINNNFISFWFSMPSDQILLSLRLKAINTDTVQSLINGYSIRHGNFDYKLAEIKEGLRIG